MRLYNTPARAVQEFTPIDPKRVKVYTCGPTVYSKQHIGNYTAYIYWDTLIRALKLAGYTPYRVMNVTDVGHLVSDSDEGEDKMEKGARVSGKTVWEVAQMYLDDYLDHFHRLGLIIPDVVARATEYIPEEIELVDTLTAKGYTYQITDGVYFDTSKFPTYADFANLDVKGLRAGARVEMSDDKKNVTDFAVWKFVRDGELHSMQWEYLGQPGYPGWHLECSAIIHTTLGETIDIHTGGIDHIQVHHTDEIAQSEAAYNKKLANYWLHNDFITIDGQKISKSLGNVYTFEDLAERGFSHMDYRMWVLQGHYRSQRNFTFDNLEGAKTRLLNWRNAAVLRHQLNSKQFVAFDAIEKDITDAIVDDLNTALALSIVDGFLSDPIKSRPEPQFIEFLDSVLGLNLINTTPDISDEQKALIQERQTARDAKDWGKSDELRDQLSAQGLQILDDTPYGPIWQYKH